MKLTYREAWKRNVRAWRIWWKLYPSVFISSALTSVFGVTAPLATVWLSAQLISELAGKRALQTLLQWVLLILITQAALQLAKGLCSRWKEYSLDVVYRMDEQVYMEKMTSLDYADIDRQYVYDLFSQIRQNENYTGYGIHMAFHIFEHDFVTGVVQIVGGMALFVTMFLQKVPADSPLAFLNSPLTAVAVLAALLLIAVLVPLLYSKGQQYLSDYTPKARFGNRLFGFFGFNIREHDRASDMRMYRQQENICSVYFGRSNMFSADSEIGKASRGPMGLFTGASAGLSMGAVGLVYLFVCLKAWGGAFGVGEITQYVGAATQFFLGISALLDAAAEIRINGEFLGTTYEFLDIPNKMYQGSLTTEKRSDRKYEIEFKDVSFRYPGTKQYALRHVNLKFSVGSRLAVVGPNGSGKTTFIKLLCRLYDPEEGQILLNGIDIRKYRYEDYIGIFSVVFQDFRLFALPLGENVAACCDYDRARVQKALDDAGFGGKYTPDTWLYKDLEKEGVEVSGGEAQKIAIARALYKDAPFIILDEPTAALDPIAEAEIYSKFDEIVTDKTAVYISHRLSSCKFCDEIVVFEKGRIVQQGTHDDRKSSIMGTLHPRPVHEI
ncbi:MAG: ABC transporter ATP-binding protein/permease, partial [Clostridiales bacterium]|nr:ABC transporter ATP-binding protein/permease [Clostridiales bacterium]